jgi:hypothetical protein
MISSSFGPCGQIRVVCFAAGLAVHYRWYERAAVPSLSLDEVVEPARDGRRRHPASCESITATKPNTRARASDVESPGAANGRGGRANYGSPSFWIARPICVESRVDR